MSEESGTTGVAAGADQSSAGNEGAASVDSTNAGASPGTGVENPGAQATQEDLIAFKYKVDGEEREAKLTKEQLAKEYQLYEASRVRIQQAAQVQKQNEQLLQLAQRNPQAFLQQFGHDLAKMQEEALRAKIEEELLTPEERRLKHLETELKSFQDKEQQARAYQQQQQQQQLEQYHQDSYQRQVDEALASNPHVPKTPFTVNLITSYMSKAIDAGYHDVKASDVMHLVQEDYQRVFADTFSHAPDDMIVKLLGQNAGKVNQAYVRSVKPNAQASAPSQPAAQASDRKMTYDEALAESRRRMKEDGLI